MNDESFKFLDGKPFPISVVKRHHEKNEQLFEKHLHNNELQFFYFINGGAMIYCGHNHYAVTPESVILINNNEIHNSDQLSKAVELFIIKIDLDLLDLCTVPVCNEKYILPIKQNMLLFHNKIESENIKETLKHMIAEYEEKPNGYELQLLSLIYRIISELFISEVAKSLSKRNAEQLGKTRAGFQRVLEYIEMNYESEIKLSYAAKLSGMSKGYFCACFKQMTGKSFTEYLNLFRVEKAALLLKQSKSSITDIALSVGFEDVSYFCRIFKKYMGQAPSFYRTSA